MHGVRLSESTPQEAAEARAEPDPSKLQSNAVSKESESQVKTQALASNQDSQAWVVVQTLPTLKIAQGDTFL